MNKHPRTLLYDIENSYLIGAAWEVYETNIIEVLQEPYILSVAYKWLGEKRVHVLTLPMFHGYRVFKPEDEEALVRAFHSVMEEADFLCGHNGTDFDFKKLNAAFLKYGMPPTKPAKMIDTLKAARQVAKFPSNKLDDLGNTLGLGRKLPHTGKHLWTACMNGDQKAWKTMAEYNIQDVRLLESVYLRLRPYMSNHPNLNIEKTFTDQGCPGCGSKRFQARGHGRTRTQEFPRFQCQDCGRWFRGKGETLEVKTELR